MFLLRLRIQLGPRGCDETVAFCEDAIFNFKDLLAEPSLLSLSFGNLSLDARLLRQIGCFSAFVAQLADSFLDVAEGLFGCGHLIVGPAVKLCHLRLKELSIPSRDGL